MAADMSPGLFKGTVGPGLHTRGHTQRCEPRTETSGKIHTSTQMAVSLLPAHMVLIWIFKGMKGMMRVLGGIPAARASRPNGPRPAATGTRNLHRDRCRAATWTPSHGLFACSLTYLWSVLLELPALLDEPLPRLLALILSVRQYCCGGIEFPLPPNHL